MAKARVLLIDDDREVGEAVSLVLTGAGFLVTREASGEGALERVSREPFDVVLTDLRLEGMSGFEVVRQLRALRPALPVVVMTGYGTTDTAIEAMKLGAYDYVVKPLNSAELLPILGSAAEAGWRQAHAPMPVEPREATVGLVGASRVMQAVYKEIGRLAARPVAVLIRGETGTGKELVARAIGRHSERADRPFIAVNCAALPETLLESELFGHERGAFTGADNRRAGRFEQANGGTLFLDEIGDLTPAVQVKLLRVLQEQRFQRLGGTESISADVRIIAATHRDLERMITRHEFREDLYYRLAVAVIHLPALRDRMEDLPLLVGHFARRHGPELGNPAAVFLGEALDRLREHFWPGNVRELENVVRKAILQAQGYPVTGAQVAMVLAAAAPDRSAPGTDPTLREIAAGLLRRAQAGELKDLHVHMIQEAERELLAQTMERAAGNLSLAARWLGTSRVTLRGRLRQLGLRHEPGDDESDDPPKHD